MSLYTSIAYGLEIRLQVQLSWSVDREVKSVLCNGTHEPSNQMAIDIVAGSRQQSKSWTVPRQMQLFTLIVERCLKVILPPTRRDFVYLSR